jgi:hypothetical protein
VLLNEERHENAKPLNRFEGVEVEPLVFQRTPESSLPVARKFVAGGSEITAAREIKGKLASLGVCGIP